MGKLRVHRSQERPGQKWCPKCAEWKGLDTFFKGKGYCKPCSNAYKRHWYKELGGKAWRQARDGYTGQTEPRVKARKRARAEAKALIIDTLGPGCALCRFQGWPGALHVHHLRPDLKHPKLGKGHLITTLPRAALIAELKACCLLCANCHAGVETGYLCLEAALGVQQGPTNPPGRPRCNRNGIGVSEIPAPSNPAGGSA